MSLTDVILRVPALIEQARDAQTVAAMSGDARMHIPTLQAAHSTLATKLDELRTLTQQCIDMANSVRPHQVGGEIDGVKRGARASAEALLAIVGTLRQHDRDLVQAMDGIVRSVQQMAATDDQGAAALGAAGRS